MKILTNENEDSAKFTKVTNLIRRTITGIILGGLVVIACFVPHPLLLLFLTMIWIGMATYEFLNIFPKPSKLNHSLVIALNLAFPTLFYITKEPRLFLCLPLFIFGYALLVRNQYYLIVSLGVFTLFYLGFLPAHLLLLKIWVGEKNLSPWIVFFPVLFTWLNDTTAYGIGTLFVKGIKWSHKLAPQISPNKTIEGFLGSIGVSIIFAILFLKHYYPEISQLVWVLLAVVLSLGAQIGDLVESGFKREAGIKDSSNILPGHGGFLDRIDSLIFTLPLFYYFLIYILPGLIVRRY